MEITCSIMHLPFGCAVVIVTPNTHHHTRKVRVYRKCRAIQNIAGPRPGTCSLLYRKKQTFTTHQLLRRQRPRPRDTRPFKFKALRAFLQHIMITVTLKIRAIAQFFGCETTTLEYSCLYASSSVFCGTRRLQSNERSSFEVIRDRGSKT